ncbi:MAG: lysA 2, partial [Verrucomicrobiales bacterium]|nr:lysA 2 [Verrucomicrobiales bacterium]
MTPLNFGHSKAQRDFWHTLARRLISKEQTPFYICSIAPIEQALEELDTAFAGLPLKHWLSFKTQPLHPLIRWWQQQGRGVEVVSEFEFLSALQEKFSPQQILVNGPAKHHWLSRHAVRDISVNFDSVNEAKALLPLAKKLNWRIGIRINTREEFDSEAPEFPTHFGFLGDEAVSILKKLQREKVRLEMVHFHLRTNIGHAAVYQRALDEVSEICRAAKFSPKIINCGGGFPAPNVLNREGKPVNATFRLPEMRDVYQQLLKQFPTVDEIWLENGRWLSARSGVLVVKILDVKQRGDMRYLVCNGGRTMNAMISAWVQHEITSIPTRTGKTIATTVNGPTCMPFDHLTRRPLPASLRVGDHLLWHDAGAYHLSWETRFSHGLPSVFWHDGKQIKKVRERESFA